MKCQEWEKEIDKLSKDELTVFLAAYNNICKWETFRDEFQLKWFGWMIPYVEQRIEQLAKEA